MKYNHEKADEIRQSVDPSGKIYDNIHDRIKKYTILPDFAEGEGAKISYGNNPYNGISKNMAEKIITTAEIIRDCLNSDSVKKQMIDSNSHLADRGAEDIFGIVLGNLLYGLKGIREEDLSDITGLVGGIYDVEEV